MLQYFPFNGEFKSVVVFWQTHHTIKVTVKFDWLKKKSFTSLALPVVLLRLQNFNNREAPESSSTKLVAGTALQKWINWVCRSGLCSTLRPPSPAGLPSESDVIAINRDDAGELKGRLFCDGGLWKLLMAFGGRSQSLRRGKLHHSKRRGFGKKRYSSLKWLLIVEMDQ